MSNRRCGRCLNTPRRDDLMQVVQWQLPNGSTNTACVCEPCQYALRGFEPPAPRRYEVGTRMPVESDGRTCILVCGLCRLALMDHEDVRPIRLHPDDVEGLDLKPGCYSACPGCIDLFKPAIHWRLAGDPTQAGFAADQGHVIPALVAFAGDWLL